MKCQNLFQNKNVLKCNLNFCYHQTLGSLRVPLFTMGDGHRGFPAFLTNQFAGNAKYQLLHGLKISKLLSEKELDQAVQASSQIFKKS